ncbi:MAG: DUF550 domain-containing protein, partial [Defluviitaleaceae bacterium]|nr:DUF550 domain-containing protein [Defluviitaleaceae bacterium]
RGGGIFDPGSPITWQEAMTLIVNASKLAGLEGEYSSDAMLAAYDGINEVDEWAHNNVAYYTGSNLFVHEGRLRPTVKITRGETAAAILKLLQEAELVDVKVIF